MVASHEIAPVDTGDGELVQRLPAEEASGLMAITKGEIDIQVATSKRYPRSMKRFLENAQTMATLDEATATSCYYALKRGGKIIEGPSVRLAEIVASCWGNMRSGYRIVDEGERFVTAQGVAWDMETNNLVSAEVLRRITGRDGERYSDDMIGQTANAAGKIAYRNAVFSVVPRAFVNRLWQAAKKVALGNAQSLTKMRQEWFDVLAKAGVEPERVLAYLEKPAVEDVTLEDLGLLKGTWTAIREGRGTIESVFPAAELKPGTHGFGFKKQAAQQEPPPPAEHDAPKGTEASKTTAAKKSRVEGATRSEREEQWLAQKEREAREAMASEEPPEPGSEG